MPKFKDYKERIDGILTNPDTALAEIGGIYEDLESDLTTLESMTDENGKLKDQIDDLRETNIRLYMQTTGEATEETGKESEEDAGEESVEEFFNDLMGEE